jgi:hypothetical protein
MNRELRVAEDSPEVVAGMLLRFLSTDAWECKIGFPESLYVFLNQLVPALNDNAIGRQLRTIRKHLPGSGSQRSPADRAADDRRPSEGRIPSFSTQRKRSE